MGVVWLIERLGSDGVARMLMGNFAVRLFASVESFAKLLRASRQHTPHLLIVNDSCCTWPPERLASFLDGYLTGIPCLLITDEPDINEPRLHVCGHPSEEFAFVAQVMHLVSSAGNQSLRYRDLRLDLERSELVMGDDDNGITLSPKESLLLKYFLGEPGVCHTREQIRHFVWNGMRISTRNIDSHISRLRRRLEGSVVSIDSVYGDGYILK